MLPSLRLRRARSSLIVQSPDSPHSLSCGSDDLPLDQHRVDRAADVVADEEALDHDRTTVALDAHLGEVHGVGHAIVVKVASAVSSPSAPRAIAASLSEGPPGASHTHDPITGDGKTVGRGLQQLPGRLQQFATQLCCGDRHRPACRRRATALSARW